MARLADGSFGVIVTDPPYSEHTHACGRRGSVRPEPGEGKAAFSRNRELGFEHLGADVRSAAARQFARLVTRWVLVFTDAEGIGGWIADLTAAGLEHVRVGAWIKTGATPQFTGDRPATGFEAIVISHPRGRKRWNGGGRHAVWEHPIVLNRGGDQPRLHTTQKPLGLMEALIRDFTEPGERVLDPFAGSATTGVACVRLGRQFFGFERDEKYHSLAVKRLNDTREQMQLFNGGVK